MLGGCKLRFYENVFIRMIGFYLFNFALLSCLIWLYFNIHKYYIITIVIIVIIINLTDAIIDSQLICSTILDLDRKYIIYSLLLTINIENTIITLA